LAQEEGLHAVLGLAAVVLDVFTDTDEVADRLLGRGRHADRREFTGSVQACEVAGIDPIGLHAGTGSAGDHRGGDHIARDAERAQQPVGLVAGGAGLVAGDRMDGYTGKKLDDDTLQIEP
jgi:hypothetical protein